MAEGPRLRWSHARPGREPTITPEAKVWLVSLVCRKAKDLAIPDERVDNAASSPPRSRAWTRGGHACLANLAQGTVCKIIDQEEVKPHKVRYDLEQRIPDLQEDGRSAVRSSSRSEEF